VGTWHDADLDPAARGTPSSSARLLGVDLIIIRQLAAKVEPYVRADGKGLEPLMQLERQLRPEASRRRRGGYIDRRRTPTTEPLP
jgi:hypothetical protein